VASADIQGIRLAADPDPDRGGRVAPRPIVKLVLRADKATRAGRVPSRYGHGGKGSLVTTIYLVQHGDKQRVPGDPGLTELGQRQAAATARWLQGMGLEALYSSPLRRARETAEPISRGSGLAIRVDTRLRERLNWDGTQAFDAFLGDWERSTKDRDLVLSNGESSRSAGARLRVFLAGLAGGSGPVAVVSHGGVTVDLLRNLLDDAALPARLVDDGVPPCAITRFDDLRVTGIAATGHLSDL
jgi:broad specificity phosphatase PhoE